ncbi:MAG TPA: hypothetical protein VKA53_01745 [Thermoanaerobaculia bacterium]|nr:hypothetical protein [Thermoanaerobaculia bacterium]
MRQTFAVVTGFVAWSVLWLLFNLLLRNLRLVPAEATEPVTAAKTLLLLLAGSLVISLISGYLAAAIRGKGGYGVIVVLGLLLLAVGIFFQVQYWHLMPLWYHLTFLVLLLPLCLVGARLRFGTS